jgi:NAD(P)-dependent dehydrogenase (short-subunit alcohol dehydrogenase family)
MSLVMDVDDDASVSEGIATAIDRHGHLDALVTCAGWGLAGPFEQTPISDAKAQVETNFWGSVRAVQAALPAMRANGSGRVVLVSSIGGVLGLPFQAFYSASKFALEGLGEAVAYEVEPHGIKVTVVEPGNIRTEFTDKRRVVPGHGPGETYAKAMAKALGVMEHDERNGVPAQDVAAVVCKVLAAKRPPRRVSVGRSSERVGLVAKRLLPFSVFQAAAKGSLGV